MRALIYTKPSRILIVYMPLCFVTFILRLCDAFGDAAGYSWVILFVWDISRAEGVFSVGAALIPASVAVILTACCAKNECLRLIAEFTCINHLEGCQLVKLK
jgi:hypothetical protein